MEKYKIGNVPFVWKTNNFPLKQDHFMKKFLVEEKTGMIEAEEVVYETYVEDLEKYSSGQLLQKNGLYELYQLPEGKFIIYHWASCRFAFGFWTEPLERGNIIPCYFHPDMEMQIPLDAVRFFSCAGIHSKLLQKDGIVFHSSYIEWNGKAILFAGPSGTGKSTQAELWKTYNQAEIINGDRALLQKRDGIWMAHGYPCCGSSKICRNRSLPIAALVVLEQGETNLVSVMKNSDKMRAIISGSEAYRWSIYEIDCICRIAEQIIQEIPIIKLACRPEQEAVEVLHKWIEES